MRVVAIKPNTNKNINHSIPEAQAKIDYSHNSLKPDGMIKQSNFSFTTDCLMGDDISLIYPARRKFVPDSSTLGQI